MPKHHSEKEDRPRHVSKKSRKHHQSDSDSYDSQYSSNSEDQTEDHDIFSAENYQFLLQQYTSLYNASAQNSEQTTQMLEAQIVKNEDYIQQIQQQFENQNSQLQQILVNMQKQQNNGQSNLINELLQNLSNIKQKDLTASQLTINSDAPNVQKLQKSYSSLQNIKQQLQNYNDIIAAFNILTGIHIAPATSKEIAVKYLNDVRMDIANTSYVFSLGSCTNKQNYVGLLTVTGTDQFTVQCVRPPKNQQTEAYTETYENLDVAEVRLLFQQFIANYNEQ